MKFLGILSITLVLIVFLPALLEKIIIILDKNNFPIIKLDSEHMDLYTAVLTSVITLSGVIITIKHDNNSKRYDESIIYKPVLVVDGINKCINHYQREVRIRLPFISQNSDLDKENKEKLFDQQQEDNHKYILLLKNRGRGETFNAVIDCFEITDINWDKTDLYYTNGTDQYIGEVLKEEYVGIHVNLPKYLFLPKEMNNALCYELTTKIIISYSDMFNRNRYQYCVYVTHEVIIEKFETLEPYHYKNGFKYAKVKYKIKEIMPEKRIYSKKRKEFVFESAIS